MSLTPETRRPSFRDFLALAGVSDAPMVTSARGRAMLANMPMLFNNTAGIGSLTYAAQMPASDDMITGFFAMVCRTPGTCRALAFELAKDNMMEESTFVVSTKPTMMLLSEGLLAKHVRTTASPI
jgi:hypothetical protein